MKSFTLSDGIFLPKGVLLVVPAMMSGLGPGFIGDPDVFGGFRSNKNFAYGDADQLNKIQCVTISPPYLAFGDGKHACPGRSPAMGGIKVVALPYATAVCIKYDKDSPLLPCMNSGEAINPHPARTLSFKKIQVPKKLDL